MLDKTYRIPKQNIPQIVRQGKKLTCNYFDLKFWYDNSLDHPLFAFIVSTKIDKRAVVRNTIKRKLRASVYSLIKSGFTFRNGNYIFLVRNVEISKLKSQEIAEIIYRTIETRNATRDS
jgi:ribonuclease P protein component